MSQPSVNAELRRMLTINSIGWGTCGAVFAQDQACTVVKLAKNDPMELWNDYIKHKKIAKQFKRFRIEEVRIPGRYFFIPSDLTEWFERSPGLTEAAKDVCNLPTCALLTQRIHTLPRPIRHLLIEKYCQPSIKHQALAAPGNNDCLLRLHLNWMLELKLDVDAMARRMGVALAIMHWVAKTDANDVEFMLGCSTTKVPLEDDEMDADTIKTLIYTGPSSCITEDFFGHKTELWVLDFDKVRPITLVDDAGVAQAAEAFRDESGHYVELPGKFISEVTEAERRRLAERKG
ncbi:hypothetical protein C8A03DRAFT_48443 [Achaetomium macrosporum]|uniref:DUF3669 domain-containing protein n=1 Tax=Achaetomium macrosporum TaxID=79813 RepID=A0AAN7C1F4_9PEZI|nr:hypothetical protein C8A03DRAFT_48443 [Achaetomium macrosporum]